MRGVARVDIDIELPPEVKKLLETNEAEIAKMIGDEARGSTAFKDKTGKLRKKIEEEEKDFGWIVIAKAPHAHLVEFGHGGPSPAPPHPFLRPAKESVISKVK